MATRVNHKHSKGFTLVEAMVGLIMFAAALSGLAPLIIISRAFALRSDSRIGAIAVAQQVMDSIRQVDVTTLPSTGTVTTLPSGDSIAALPYKGKIYSATITYCATSTYCDTNTRQVQVNVYLDGNTVATPTRNCDPNGRADQIQCPLFQLSSIFARLQ